MGDAAHLSQSLKTHALALGFQAVGIAPARRPEGLNRLDEWLGRGFDGEMAYIRRRRAAYEHPQHVLPDVASIVVLLSSYRTTEPASPAAGQGRISRYAFSGHDYHDVIRIRLKQLAAFLREQVPPARVRCTIDTAPLLERELAQLSGLGWQGKNTLLLHKQLGSWFFISELLTTVELEYDQPFAADHCGTCRACLDICPTDAFVQPHVLDANRCISYLTIEHRSEIPTELREAIGDWLFGCDLCQDVCPWNHKAPVVADPAFEPAATLNPIDLLPLFDLSEETFRQQFHGTPLMRAGRAGILRNAAIVLGNQRDRRAIPVLMRALADASPLVRSAAEWALARLQG